MATGLVAITERAADGGPLLNTGEDESIAHVAPDVGIVLEEGPVQQNGTLYITTKRLIWLSNDNLQKGYAVSFLSLSMHAISRNPNAYPVPCIYTQVTIMLFTLPPRSVAMVAFIYFPGDGAETVQIESGDSDSEYEEADDMEDSLETECDEEEDLSKVEEMRLVPRDPDILDQIFQVLCDCALLNPDPTGVEVTLGSGLTFQQKYDGWTGGITMPRRETNLVVSQNRSRTHFDLGSTLSTSDPDHHRIQVSFFLEPRNLGGARPLALNPFVLAEQEGEGEWYFNVNEVLGGRPIGEDDDKPFDVTDISELHIHDPRFEDAEEELEEDGAA
ncbi:hypothetical protein AXG93_1923s1450 [Marchantia polymorpha subsp. ruderalis]|uniref:Chloride conductance regulatory protein ICln n=1 Tax=Marchantia polymorpha subsp. ruderalis TaxID=1480154 RepID=A0A176VCF6_MARPO|nr:hypothetical protein AXG93_1923s1450 [Marchantia polymorpha subsp. ruderalis]